MQAHKSTELTSQGIHRELGRRSWRAITHKACVKQWKSFSNINSSLLAYVTYLMYVSQDSETARVTCSNQHMPGTFQVLTYWEKQQVQGEEQHEGISIFHFPGSWEWEIFCSCQRQYQLYTEALRHTGCALCVLLEKPLYMQSWISSQVPKYSIDHLHHHIFYLFYCEIVEVLPESWGLFLQAVIPPTHRWMNSTYRNGSRGNPESYTVNWEFWLPLLLRWSCS